MKTTGQFNDDIYPALAAKDRDIVNRLNGKKSFAEVPKEERAALRSDMYLVSESLNKLNKQGKLTDPEQKAILNDFRSKLTANDPIHPDMGESRRRLRSWLRNDDRLETDCRYRGRKNWENRT